MLWEVYHDIVVNGRSFAVNTPGGVHGVTGNAIVARVVSSTTICRVQFSGDSIRAGSG